MNNSLEKYFSLKESGKIIVGIDEVGRGALAGPLVVCGVILSSQINGLKDSKRLSPKRRTELSKEIIKNSIYEIMQFSPQEIDQIGLHQANLQLMHNCALKLMQNSSSVAYFDGYCPKQNKRYYSMVDGDNLIAEISAASIVAKVFRDQIMMEYSEQFPNYFFNKNVGYGTKEHLVALKKYGPCPIHRYSFSPIKQRFKSSIL